MLVSSSRGRATILGLHLFLTPLSIAPNAFADSIEISPNEQMVWGVAFSPDDQYVVATGQDGAVLIWERESCSLESLLIPIPINDNVGSNNILGIAWSPTKAEFATAMRDGSVRLWNFKGKGTRWDKEKAVYTRSSSTEGSSSLGMRSVAFSPDGTLLAAAGHGPSIYVWSTDSENAQPRILDGKTSLINTVSFVRDNSTLISAGRDGTIRFWDLNHETEVRTIKTPGGVVYNAAVSPNGRYVAAASGGPGVTGTRAQTVVYNLNTGEEIRRFTIKEPRILWSLAFSPDSQFLAAGTFWDSQIHFFGLEQGQEIWATPFPRESDIKGLAFSHTGKFLLAGVDLDAPYLLDARTGVVLKRYGGTTCDFKK